MDSIAASSLADRSPDVRDDVAARPATTRSRITNGKQLLVGIDGRSAEARRYRDIAIALADDLGGQDKLSEPARILVRQAAALTIQVEGLQSKIVLGEAVDLEQLTRLSNVLGRTLHRLGLERAAMASPPVSVKAWPKTEAAPRLTVQEFLRARDARRAAP
jgi:hypothetical protein